MAGRALLASILLIGVLGLSLWLARTEIAERLAIAALEQAGLAPAVLTVEDIGLSGARATAIAIGPDGGPRADSVEIDYSLTGLFSGRAEAVRIEGLDAHGAIDAKGSLSIPALDPVLGGDSSGGPAIPVLPFDRIELEDFALSLETPEGPVVIAGDGNLRVTGPDTIDFAVEISDLHTEWDERVSLKGTVRGSEDGTLGLDGQMEGMIVGPRLSLSFSSMVTGFMAGADLSGKVVFSRLDATTEIFQVEGIAGEIAYENKGEEPQNLSFIFDLPKARLYDRVIGPGHVEARFNGTRIALTGNLDSEAGRLSFDAEGDPDDPDEPLAFTLGGALDPAILAALAGIENAPSGGISVTANGSLAAPTDFMDSATPELAALLEALRIEARIRSNLTDIALPGVFKATTLTGEADLSVDGRKAMLNLLSGFGLAGLTIEPELIDDLPPDLADALNMGAERALSVSGEAPLRLTLAPSAGAYAVTVSGALAAKGAEPSPTLAVEGAMTLDLDFTLRSMVARSVEVDFGDLRYAGMAGDVAIRLRDLKSTSDLTTGDVALRLRGSGRPAPSIDLGITKLDLDGGFRYADRALSLALNDRTRLSLASLQVDGDPILAAPITLRVRSGDGSTIAGRTSHPAGVDYDLSLVHSQLALNLPDADGPTAFDFEGGSLRATGNSEAMTLNWTSAGMAVADLSLSLDRFKLDATLHGLSGGLRGTARLRSTLHHTAEKEAVLPLALALDARLAAGVLSATAKLHDTGERIVLTGEARHSLETGSGEAAFRAKRIEFLETVFQPQELFPALADIEARIDGWADLAGTAAWSAGGFDSGMELALKIQSLISPEATLKDMAGVIVFDSLSPLTTPPEQIIVFGYADVGVPLESGQLVLQVKPGPIIRAEARDFDLYGGRVFVDPFDYDPSDDRLTLVLGASGVRIEDMLAPARLGTLEATGVLDGRIPIAVRDGELVISGGVLESFEGGHIRYIPEEVGDAVRKMDEGTGLFLDAVSNFEYSSFRVTIDEAENQEMVLGLEIDGRNPAVYEGVPIELNIAITGQVREVLYSGISTYELPQRIADALEKFKE